MSDDALWVREPHAGRSIASFRVSAHLHTEQTSYQRIDVYESAFFGRILTLDGLVMLTTRDEFVYHEMLVHVPLLSLPQPRRVLVIGGGDTGCVREALRHPGVEHVVQCEIDRRVTEVCAEHYDWVAAVQSDPRAELVFDDGVAFMARNQAAFDLIVVDSTDPIGPAVGLFGRDFYQTAARSLRPGGVLTAQTESPHWDLPTLRRIYRELDGMFSHVHPYLGWIPTYPSGMWSWAYASNERSPHDHFDAARAADLAEGCHYWTPDLQRAAFALPAFVRRGLEGTNHFARFEPDELPFDLPSDPPGAP